MWRFIKSFLLCRHDWRRIRDPDAILCYVGGFKGLHMCAHCQRLKWVDARSPEYGGRDSQT